MPDTPAGSGSKNADWLTHKIGPLPVWGWALLAAAVWYWYTHYGPGSAAATTTTTTTGGGITDVFVNRRGRGDAEPGPGGQWDYREVATGTESLDQVARVRHTTPAHIEKVTRASPKISKANLRRFNKYVAGGTSKPMPRGLVYYTTGKGTIEETPAGGGTSTSSGGGTTKPDIDEPKPAYPARSGPAIADARTQQPASMPELQPIEKTSPETGTSRWRTAA